jgi:hypothetical protein
MLGDHPDGKVSVVDDLMQTQHQVTFYFGDVENHPGLLKAGRGGLLSS